MNKEQFYANLKNKNIELTDIQKSQFEKYFELVVSWN